MTSYLLEYTTGVPLLPGESGSPDQALVGVVGASGFVVTPRFASGLFK